jgi:hypothetical protein
MYDALLGGSHNFEVDRVAADQAAALVPDLPKVAMSNRMFLRRAVRHLIHAGIRQFLDIGAGIHRRQHPQGRPAGRPAVPRRVHRHRRPHRALDLQPPRSDRPTIDLTHQRIKRRPILGGLITEYERAA